MSNDNQDNKNDQARTSNEFDANPLMAVYNPLPPQREARARFYWEEPWLEAAAEGAPAPDAVQQAFEN